MVHMVRAMNTKNVLYLIVHTSNCHAITSQLKLSTCAPIDTPFPVCSIVYMEWTSSTSTWLLLLLLLASAAAVPVNIAKSFQLKWEMRGMGDWNGMGRTDGRRRRMRFMCAWNETRNECPSRKHLFRTNMYNGSFHLTIVAHTRPTFLAIAARNAYENRNEMLRTHWPTYYNVVAWIYITWTVWTAKVHTRTAHTLGPIARRTEKDEIANFLGENGFSCTIFGATHTRACPPHTYKILWDDDDDRRPSSTMTHENRVSAVFCFLRWNGVRRQHDHSDQSVPMNSHIYHRLHTHTSHRLWCAVVVRRRIPIVSFHYSSNVQSALHDKGFARLTFICQRTSSSSHTMDNGTCVDVSAYLLRYIVHLAKNVVSGAMCIYTNVITTERNEVGDVKKNVGRCEWNQRVAFDTHATDQRLSSSLP